MDAAPEPRLTAEDRANLERLEPLAPEALLGALGSQLLADEGVVRSTPPTDEQSRAAASTFLERSRDSLCDLVAKQPHLVRLLQESELIDSADKVAALLVCFKSALTPVLAATLALLVARHGLRWLCPELAKL